MTCPHCIIRTLVKISVVVADETLTMHSCSSCNLRWWEGSNGPVPLSGVMARAATVRRREVPVGGR